MIKQNWEEYLSTHLLVEKDGFYQLPYLSNNPDMMVNSVLQFPVSVHNKKANAVQTDNAVTKGIMKYRPISEGLCILSTELQVKQNIISKAVFDEKQPSDYFVLSFSVFEYQFPVDKSYINFAHLTSTTCTFYKPRTEVTTYFYADSAGRFYNIFFTREWAFQHLKNLSAAKRKHLEKLLDRQKGFLNWLDIVPDAVQLSEKIWQILQTDEGGVKNKKELAAMVENIVLNFLETSATDKRIQEHIPMRNQDYANVATADRLILTNLHEFMGVEAIARAVHLSPTKLKSIFKSVFGFSMLQYHKEKNMLLAMQLILHTELSIKSIALETGYLSPSKFTAAFKKRFGQLPQQVRK